MWRGDFNATNRDLPGEVFVSCIAIVFVDISVGKTSTERQLTFVLCKKMVLHLYSGSLLFIHMYIYIMVQCFLIVVCVVCVACRYARYAWPHLLIYKWRRQCRRASIVSQQSSQDTLVTSGQWWTYRRTRDSLCMLSPRHVTRQHVCGSEKTRESDKTCSEDITAAQAVCHVYLCGTWWDRVWEKEM